jgi:hypothetical protein
MLASLASPWPCSVKDNFLQVATLLTNKFNAQLIVQFIVGVAYLNTLELIVARSFRAHDPHVPCGDLVPPWTID